MLTLDKIYQASHVLRSVIRKTDLIQAPKLCPDCNLFLKTENLQVTGSFKVRGAYYMMSQLTEEEKARGVCGSPEPLYRPCGAGWPAGGLPCQKYRALPGAPHSRGSHLLAGERQPKPENPL